MRSFGYEIIKNEAKMLYIHTLKDLTVKSADIECTSLIREIKKGNKMPLDESQVEKQLSIFFVSKIDVEHMRKALDMIPETVNEIVALSKSGKNLEAINLKRACSGLNEITAPLEKNMEYAIKLIAFQETFIPKITDLLSQIPKLKTDAEKKSFDESMSLFFAKILRNKKDFAFAYSDIINEAHTARMNNLTESMVHGFFFHVPIEEYLKKQEGKDLAKGQSSEAAAVDSINKQILLIKEGVDRAYDANTRMLNMAVVLYAYIKWIRGD
jgi:hypothetical protein